jgi:hypothetical protein
MEGIRRNRGEGLVLGKGRKLPVFQVFTAIGKEVKEQKQKRSVKMFF